MLKLKVSTYVQIVSVAAVLAAFGISGAIASDSTSPLSKQQVKALIKSAKTPDEHMKLARYYWYEADKLKSEAKDHEEMEADYKENPSLHPLPKWPTMGEHCKDLAGYYAKAATEAEQLARAHEDMAKAAK